MASAVGDGGTDGGASTLIARLRSARGEGGASRLVYSGLGLLRGISFTNTYHVRIIESNRYIFYIYTLGTDDYLRICIKFTSRDCEGRSGKAPPFRVGSSHTVLE